MKLMRKNKNRAIEQDLEIQYAANGGGYVVSDLHMFAQWSNAGKYLDQIHAAAACADFFVLNGDIFDFKWTTLMSVRETMSKAVEWLRGFAMAYPECAVFYVLGNHDCHTEFREKLAQLADELDNFNWNASHVRIGNALFLHGDLPIEGKNPYSRNGDSTIRKKSGILGRSYGRLIKMGAHKGLRYLFYKRRSAKLILRELTAFGLDQSVTDVYFGHTHVPFSGHARDGVTFHNTGSAIGDLGFNMLKFEI